MSGGEGRGSNVPCNFSETQCTLSELVHVMSKIESNGMRDAVKAHCAGGESIRQARCSEERFYRCSGSISRAIKGRGRAAVQPEEIDIVSACRGIAFG